MLLPNNKQKTKLEQTANCARYAYNWAVAFQIEYFSANGQYASEGFLRKSFTKHKEDNIWLYDVSNNALKQSVRDASDTFWRFVDIKKSKDYKPYSEKQVISARRNGSELTRQDMRCHPKYKKKGKSKLSFYVDPERISFTDTHVQLEKIADGGKKNQRKSNWVRLSEHGRIPIGAKYSNPRITFDGVHWWVSVGVEIDGYAEPLMIDGVGVDVGIKNLAVCSDSTVYSNINKTRKVERLEKKMHRLQRSISRKYRLNNEGKQYSKTGNITKYELKLLKINRKLSNVRLNYTHHVTSDIINRKPRFVAIEDLNVRGMMQNRHLAKAIQDQTLSEFSRQIQYKAVWRAILPVWVNRYFPSSKTCHCCGCIKKDLKLSDRTFVCHDCGNIIDRDYQAALNLAKYAMFKIAE